MQPLAIRLHPGDDIIEKLERLIQKQKIDAACILTCVGSLTTAVLRMANCEEATTLEGHFEIVSLVGLLSLHGSHLHIAISDKHGKTVGAHLLPGSRVYTTAEIVIAILPEYRFLRTIDPQTGYPELTVQPTTVTKE